MASIKQDGRTLSWLSKDDYIAISMRMYGFLHTRFNALHSHSQHPFRQAAKKR